MYWLIYTSNMLLDRNGGAVENEKKERQKKSATNLPKVTKKGCIL